MSCLLETVGLSKTFGALQAVVDVGLKVKEGTIHSIIGPNGAGKTTLFNLLTGFLKPTAGVVIFNGKEIAGLSPDKISKLGMGRSFQITSIFPDLTVGENIRIALQSRTTMSYRFFKKLHNGDGLDEKSHQVLAQTHLRDKADLPAKHLSHGEKRILDIGIGVATDPRLLLLDEPASGLVGDEITRVTDLVRDISSRVTVVLVEHNIDVVLSISDRITVLYYGEIIAEGTPDEIQSNGKVQEVYLGAGC
jgi:branched-chain amino acid transport system ATP-binding protein